MRLLSNASFSYKYLIFNSNVARFENSSILLNTPQNSSILLNTPQNSSKALEDNKKLLKWPKTPQGSSELLKGLLTGFHIFLFYRCLKIESRTKFEELLKGLSLWLKTPQRMTDTPQNSSILLKTPQNSSILLNTPQYSSIALEDINLTSQTTLC